MKKYFTVVSAKDSPVLCHIPHDSVLVPLEMRKDFVISHRALSREAKTMADMFTAALFHPLLRKYGGMVCRISRVAVDVERFPDDKDEPMAKAGMGMIYTHSSNGELMRHVTAKDRKRYLKNIYRPYHDTFRGMVRDKLQKFGQCLILDCHSFPSMPRAYEPDQSANRPDVCLGTDGFHAPKEMLLSLERQLRSAGLTVKRNSPFAGTIVPKKYFHKNPKVSSIMIEVGRTLYMDEEKLVRNKNFQNISRMVCQAVVKSISS